MRTLDEYEENERGRTHSSYKGDDMEQTVARYAHVVGDAIFEGCPRCVRCWRLVQRRRRRGSHTVRRGILTGGGVGGEAGWCPVRKSHSEQVAAGTTGKRTGYCFGGARRLIRALESWHGWQLNGGMMDHDGKFAVRCK